MSRNLDRDDLSQRFRDKCGRVLRVTDENDTIGLVPRKALARREMRDQVLSLGRYIVTPTELSTRKLLFRLGKVKLGLEGAATVQQTNYN